MSAENENSDKPEKNSKTQNEPVDDYEKNGENDEITVSASKLGFILNYVRHFPFAVKDAFSSAFKTFKSRIKGIIPENKKEGGPDNDSFPDRTPLKEDDEGAEAEAKAQDQGTKNKSISKKLSHPRLIAVAGILFIFIISAIGFYVRNMPSDKDNSGKVISSTASEKDEAGFFDFIEDIIAPSRGKRTSVELTAEEQLELMGIKYTEGEFVKQAGRNNTKVVDIFLQGGMSPNASRESDGFTPLMAAASYDRLEMATHLLDQGADINCVDKDGQTALMKAVKYNRPKVIELLLERGADYNLVDSQGNTAASIANENYGDNEVVRVFSHFGIDVSAAKKEPPKKERNLDEILSTDDIKKGEISLENLKE